MKTLKTAPKPTRPPALRTWTVEECVDGRWLWAAEIVAAGKDEAARLWAESRPACRFRVR